MYPGLMSLSGRIDKTRNQVQIFCMIKCIEDFEVTVRTHIRASLYYSKLTQTTL